MPTLDFVRSQASAFLVNESYRLHHCVRLPIFFHGLMYLTKSDPDDACVILVAISMHAHPQSFLLLSLGDLSSEDLFLTALHDWARHSDMNNEYRCSHVPLIVV